MALAIPEGYEAFYAQIKANNFDDAHAALCQSDIAVPNQEEITFVGLVTQRQFKNKSIRWHESEWKKVDRHAIEAVYQPWMKVAVSHDGAMKWIENVVDNKLSFIAFSTIEQYTLLKWYHEMGLLDVTLIDLNPSENDGNVTTLDEFGNGNNNHFAFLEDAYLKMFDDLQDAIQYRYKNPDAGIDKPSYQFVLTDDSELAVGDAYIEQWSQGILNHKDGTVIKIATSTQFMSVVIMTKRGEIAESSFEANGKAFFFEKEHSGFLKNASGEPESGFEDNIFDLLCEVPMYRYEAKRFIGLVA